MGVPPSFGSREDQYLDLRRLFLALWRGKWILLAFLALFTVGGAVLSWKVLTPQYQASALVVVEFPRVPSTISMYLPAPYSIPDLNTLVDALRGDTVLQQVIAGEGEDLSAFRARARVEVAGRRGVRLTVRDTDPQRAARLVNRWAGLVEEEARAMYGLEAMKAQWDQVVQQALDAYQEGESRLRAFTSENEVGLTALEWERLKGAYACLRGQREALEAMQAEVAALRARLTAFDAEGPVPQEVALRVWTLRAQEGYALDCASLSAVGNVRVPAPPPQMTAAEALAFLDEVEAGLAEEVEALAVAEKQMEEHGDSVGGREAWADSELQIMQAQQANAWTTYVHLRDQGRWFQFMQAKGALVKEVQEAQPPTKPVFPRPALNIVVAAVLGLALGSVVVLIKEGWLKEPGRGGAL